MKKIVAGIGFEITGGLMVIYSTLIANMSIENTTQWNTNLGRYWQTVFNIIFVILPSFCFYHSREYTV